MRPPSTRGAAPARGQGRPVAGLELGTGLPVNPVAPEEAVEELLRASTAASGEVDR